MPTQIHCKLVLQAADASLAPTSPPASGRYPNRVVAGVPWELHPLLAVTENTKELPPGTDPYLTLASSLVASSLGSSWGVRLYASGHIEQSGEWQAASGSVFHLQKSGADYTEDLVNVDPDCTLRFLLRLKPVT